MEGDKEKLHFELSEEQRISSHNVKFFKKSIGEMKKKWDLEKAELREQLENLEAKVAKNELDAEELSFQNEREIQTIQTLLEKSNHELKRHSDENGKLIKELDLSDQKMELLNGQINKLTSQNENFILENNDLQAKFFLLKKTTKKDREVYEELTQTFQENDQTAFLKIKVEKLQQLLVQSQNEVKTERMLHQDEIKVIHQRNLELEHLLHGQREKIDGWSLQANKNKDDQDYYKNQNQLLTQELAKYKKEQYPEQL